MPPDPELFDQDAADEDRTTLSPLAIPCGFTNIDNVPCQRLASIPVMLDGLPFINRDHPLLHCPRRCFLDERAPPDPDCTF